jgi:hypothetical protein
MSGFAELRVGAYTPRMSQLGRYLILAGVVLAAVGGLMLVADRLGLGRLPGDLIWRRKNTTVYIPIATSLLVSVVLTLVLNLLLRRK